MTWLSVLFWFVKYNMNESIGNQAAVLKSTLISIPVGIVIEVTSLICPAVHSRSIYLLKIVISQLSQVLDPSPQGVLLQQMRRCLLGSLTGPVIFTPWFLALLTNWLVTCWTAFNLLPLKVILVFLIYWSSTPYFLVSFSAIWWLIY
jgi:hypothetical protein